MPVVNTLPLLTSPPSNAWGLYQYCAQRVPGYDPSEYLRELNSAYIHVWEEVSKLNNYWFTNITQVTVMSQQANDFDFQFNLNGNLSAPVSARLYHISRVRALPPGNQYWLGTEARNFNDPFFLGMESNNNANGQLTGPYVWVPWGRGHVKFALPLAQATQLEVTYQFWPLAMTYLTNGSISSSGNTVTGVGTNFTQLVQPDFQAALVGPSAQEGIQAELVVYGNNNVSQIYQVQSINSDTSLTTTNPVSPALGTGNAYVLAVLPEIPREHIRVIASIAVQKMYSVAGDDARVAEWTAISASNMQMMKDSLMERQTQDPPRKVRFPYSITRGNRLFLR